MPISAGKTAALYTALRFKRYQSRQIGARVSCPERQMEKENIAWDCTMAKLPAIERQACPDQVIEWSVLSSSRGTDRADLTDD